MGVVVEMVVVLETISTESLTVVLAKGIEVVVEEGQRIRLK